MARVLLSPVRVPLVVRVVVWGDPLGLASVRRWSWERGLISGRVVKKSLVVRVSPLVALIVPRRLAL